MLKKIIVLFCFSFVLLPLTAQTSYLTVKIGYSFKNSSLKHKITVDIGTDVNHPLYQKIENTASGGIKIKQAVESSDFMLITNEIDCLTYLENNGWDLVSVSEVMVIEDKFLHYLFKHEKE